MLFVGTADRDWLWSVGIVCSTLGVVVLLIVFGAPRQRRREKKRKGEGEG